MLKIVSPSAVVSKTRLSQGFSERRYQELIIQVNGLLTQLDQGLEGEQSFEYFQHIVIKFLCALWNIQVEDQVYLSLPHEVLLPVTAGNGIYCNIQRPDDRTRMINSRSTQKDAFYELVNHVISSSSAGYLHALIITNIYEWYIFDQDEIWNMLQRHPALAHYVNHKRKGLSDYTSRQELYRWIDAAMEEDILPGTYFNLYGIKEGLIRNQADIPERLIPMGVFLYSLKNSQSEYSTQSKQAAYAREVLYTLGYEITGRADLLYVRKRKELAEKSLHQSMRFDKVMEGFSEQDRDSEVRSQLLKSIYIQSLLHLLGEDREKELERQGLIEANTVKITATQGELPVLNNSMIDKQTSSLNAKSYLDQLLKAPLWTPFPQLRIRKSHEIVLHPYAWGAMWASFWRQNYEQPWYPYSVLKGIARNILRKVVLQVFNEHLQQDYTWQQLLSEIQEMPLDTARSIFFSVRIIDPAAGQGQWLLALLHELVYIQHEMGLLTVLNGKSLEGVGLETEDFAIFVNNEQGELMTIAGDQDYVQENGYKKIQEALFHAKMEIINQCLYGITLKEDDAWVCRQWLLLSLLTDQYMIRGRRKYNWVSLKSFQPHIFTGNPLISNLPSLKTDSLPGVEALSRDPRKERLLKLKRKLASERQSLGLWDMIQLSDESDQDGKNTLEEEIQKLENQIGSRDDIWNKHIDWVSTLRELWDEQQKFRGFDLVISSPPAIRQDQFRSFNSYLKESLKSYDSQGNFYLYLMERGIRLLKPAGLFVFMTTDKWLEAQFALKFRRWLEIYNDYQIDKIEEEPGNTKGLRNSLELYGRKKDLSQGSVFVQI